MKKHYFLVFGIKDISDKDILHVMENSLDIVFEAHESGFSGEYMLYSGSFSDKVAIEPVNDENREGKFDYSLEGFSYVLYVSNYRGRNKDNLVRHNYMKSNISKINGFYLLRESMVEVNAS